MKRECECIPIKFAEYMKDLLSKAEEPEELKKLKKLAEQVKRMEGGELLLPDIEEKISEFDYINRIKEFVEKCTCSALDFITSRARRPRAKHRIIGVGEGIPESEYKDMLRDIVPDTVAAAQEELGTKGQTAIAIKLFGEDKLRQLNESQGSGILNRIYRVQRAMGHV